MQVTLDLPDDISAVFEGRWPDLPRQALEALAVEAYRTGALTESQVRRLLNLETRFEVHALLKDHRVPLRYKETDFEDDLAAHRAGRHSSGLMLIIEDGSSLRY
jgi:predicted HTH domain antitoxin